MRILAAACLAGAIALAAPAGAAVLYKTIDDKGVVTFSDLPPSDRNTEAKRIVVPESSSAVPGVVKPAEVLAGMPTPEEKIRYGDEAVQRASMQVDLAEHALAVARRPVWDVADPMKLEGPRMTRADRERIDHYRKDLKIAQQQLNDLLRTKRRVETQTMTAEAGAPIYGPSSPIYRR
jgi:hypothetical protein